MTAPLYFEDADAFRAWLERNAASHSELLVGFHKVGSGRPSMGWSESVDEALCFGWIDGVQKRIDDTRYSIRFSPRKPASIWSAINIDRIAVLTAEGRMQPAGHAAFAHRQDGRSRTYAYEQTATAALSPAEEQLFRKDKTAWAFFAAQPASYRKKLLWRIVSAKRDETRASRLAALIDASRQSIRL